MNIFSGKSLASAGRLGLLACALALAACGGGDEPGERKVRVSTFAGDGSTTVFSHPTGVAVDADGNVYVADLENHRIRKVSPQGVANTFAGSTQGFANHANPLQAQFDLPAGVAVDAGGGNVYVADHNNSRVRRINSAGVVSTLAGPNVASQEQNDFLFWPAGVAVDTAGNVYLADTGRNRIRKISPTGDVITLAGPDIPGGTTPDSFLSPTGVAVDFDGNVYVADSGRKKIRKISPTGAVSTLAGGLDGNGQNIFSKPYGVAVAPDGSLVVTDQDTHRIYKVTSSGAVSLIAGGGAGDFLDGDAEQARFSFPSGVAVDASGHIYVADMFNNRIRKITGAF